jgi:hypothetical protein
MWSDYKPGRFTPKEIVPDTYRREGSADSESIWTRWWIREYPLPLRIEPRLSVGPSCSIASLLAALSDSSLLVFRRSMVWREGYWVLEFVVSSLKKGARLQSYCRFQMLQIQIYPPKYCMSCCLISIMNVNKVSGHMVSSIWMPHKGNLVSILYAVDKVH